MIKEAREGKSNLNFSKNNKNKIKQDENCCIRDYKWFIKGKFLFGILNFKEPKAF